ncbi:MAG: sigma-70 family RNA polymerase sigma factor [Polyangiaceae bacterium]
MSRPLTRDEQILIRSASALVERYARSFARDWPRNTAQEFESVGNEALCHAALHFDASIGAPFPAFARSYVVGAMLKFARLQRREDDPLVHAVQMESLLGDDAAPARAAARAMRDEADDTPRGRTKRAAQEGRLRIQRMAVAYALSTDAPVEPDPEALLLDREAVTHATATINRVVAGFSRERRAVFRLLRIQHKPREEVGAALGISVSTVKRHMRAIEQEMKDAFVEAGIEPREALDRAWYDFAGGGDDDPA